MHRLGGKLEQQIGRRACVADWAARMCTDLAASLCNVLGDSVNYFN